MKSKEVIKLVAVTILLVAMNATAGHDNNIKWRDIIGVVTAGDLVGVPGIPGGAPWSTQSGGAKVNLSNGQVQFEVKGLVLAAGSALGLTGLPIGTTAGIPEVVGTLICNVSGAGGASEIVDTPAVSLSATGDAKFSGKFSGPIPDVCTNDPFPAFLLRIAGGTPFDGAWIASGAVLDR